MKTRSKLFWWSLIIIWSIPESFYMIVTKELSKTAQFLFNKIGL